MPLDLDLLHADVLAHPVTSLWLYLHLFNKILWCLTVAQMFYIENEVRISSAIVKYRKVTDIFIKAKLWGFVVLAVKLMEVLHHH